MAMCYHVKMLNCQHTSSLIFNEQIPQSWFISGGHIWRVHTGWEPFRFWFQNQILNQPLRSHRKLGGSGTRKQVGIQEILGSSREPTVLLNLPGVSAGKLGFKGFCLLIYNVRQLLPIMKMLNSLQQDEKSLS